MLHVTVVSSGRPAAAVEARQELVELASRCHCAVVCIAVHTLDFKVLNGSRVEGQNFGALIRGPGLARTALLTLLGWFVSMLAGRNGKKFQVAVRRKAMMTCRVAWA